MTVTEMTRIQHSLQREDKQGFRMGWNGRKLEYKQNLCEQCHLNVAASIPQVEMNAFVNLRRSVWESYSALFTSDWILRGAVYP